MTKIRCRECWQTFDLLNEDEAEAYYYGHDCEAPICEVPIFDDGIETDICAAEAVAIRADTPCCAKHRDEYDQEEQYQTQENHD